MQHATIDLLPSSALPKRIMFVSDAWKPQVNGVVRSIEGLTKRLADLGIAIDILSPAEFPTIPMPGYSEIRLALATPRQIRKRIEAFNPDHIQIATEGPLGLMARRIARKRGGFSTTYHTRFPEYVAARIPFTGRLVYSFLRWFHNGGQGCLVAAESLATELSRRGFKTLKPWSHGVDTAAFAPIGPALQGLAKPVFLYVGRLAVEKNLDAFLSLDLPGTKLVVGTGPDEADLRRRYPDVVFAGLQTGEALAAHYRAADAFVFPSLTDTFGLVMIEAMASGLPVAAFPVTGPLDVIGQSGAGVMDNDLRKAALQCLSISRDVPLKRAQEFTWEACTRLFLDAVVSSKIMDA